MVTEHADLDDAIAAVDALDDEEFNQLIDYIRATIKTRADRRNAKAAANLKVGTRVKFKNRTKPQYLGGLTGVIEEKRQTRFIMRFDDGPVGKFRSGRIIIHAGSVEVIS